jgi:hypothetical protein
MGVLEHVISPDSLLRQWALNLGTSLEKAEQDDLTAR